ncbi:holin [Gordonia phage Forza]|uniref:Holin n=1 Tax=Gordonia phage Forza TaxID=2571247 RepID=A0A650EZI0_9CAUD|nr:holin [Gordonia phage Forza]QEM41579.1 hypothetical protein SEA_BOOPY_112 [Gordonia phage Boopy]QGT55105.1 holin [Gordonia phage Forza]UXE04253.1 holin [Gordonia phage BlueNGold]WBF03893.1 holin [Gordonia phage Mareelih]
MTVPTTSVKTGLVFGREPAVWTAAVMAVVALIAGFGVEINTDVQGLIQAVVNAVLGLIVVLKVRENVLPAVIAVISTSLPLLVAFGLNLTNEQQGLILIAAPLVLNLLFIRPQVTTKADPSVVV